MRRLFVGWWHVGLLALLVGVPAGIGLEYARRAYNQAATDEVTRQFESKGLSPPLIIDMLQPWVVPIATTILFGLVALLIFGLTVRVRRVLHSNRAA